MCFKGQRITLFGVSSFCFASEVLWALSPAKPFRAISFLTSSSHQIGRFGSFSVWLVGLGFKDAVIRGEGFGDEFMIPNPEPCTP